MFGFATIQYYGSRVFSFLLPSSWRRDFVTNAQGSDRANDASFAQQFVRMSMISRGRARVGSASVSAKAFFSNAMNRLLGSSSAILALLNMAMGIGLFFWGLGAQYAMGYAAVSFCVTVGIAQIYKIVARGIRALSALYADIQSIIGTVNSLQAALEEQDKCLKDIREELEKLQPVIEAQKNLTTQVQDFEQKVAGQIDRLTNDITLEVHEMGTKLDGQRGFLQQDQKLQSVIEAQKNLTTQVQDFEQKVARQMDLRTNDITLEVHEMGTILNKIPTLLTRFSDEVRHSANDHTDLTEAEVAVCLSTTSRKTI